MTLYMKDDDPTHYKRKLIKFSDTHKISLTKKGFLDVSIEEYSTEESGANENGKNSTNSIMLNKTTIGENLPSLKYVINLSNNENSTSHSSVENNTEKKTRKTHNEYRSYVLDEISSTCKLYEELESGSRILKHHELFGIGNSIIQIESGIDRFIEVLEKHYYYDDRLWKYDKWKKDLNFNKSREYKPTSCINFCPHKDKCDHSANILSTVKPKYGTMEKLAG